MTQDRQIERDPQAASGKPEETGDSVVVWEMYKSLQGESTWVGLPCVFVRLSGCPLRCSYCDTEYAFYGGKRRAISEVVEEVAAMGVNLVEVTGGEPLAQPNCIVLLRALVERGHTVLLETGGAHSTDDVPEAVHTILDMKCPTSGEMKRNRYANLDNLRAHDEVKFVVGSREDYEFARDLALKHDLFDRARAVLFSPVFGAIEPREIADWLLEDDLQQARLQLQLHKFVWDPEAKGV